MLTWPQKPQPHRGESKTQIDAQQMFPSFCLEEFPLNNSTDNSKPESIKQGEIQYKLSCLFLKYGFITNSEWKRHFKQSSFKTQDHICKSSNTAVLKLH